MIRISKLWLIAGAAAIVAGATGLGFAGGWAIGFHEAPPHRLIERSYRKASIFVNGVIGRPTPKAPHHFAAELDSIFLRLHATGQRVPVERSGSGGGITSYRGEVILLTHEGGVFVATGPEDIRPFELGIPDNGFGAYRQAAESTDYADYNHNFSWHRYNDIAFIDADDFHGFATSYTEFDGDEVCYRNTVALLDLPRDAPPAHALAVGPDSWRVVFRSKPCLPLKREWRALEGHMAGGRIVFVAPSTLYLGSGDYHWDGVYATEILAQGPENDYGKVIAIDLAEGTAKQLTRGNRNIQGIAVDNRGDVWAVEHGPRGGDELNRVVEGANYGWPLETLGTSYNRTPWPLARSVGHHREFRSPTFAWLPSVAISALTRIENFHHAWDGDLLMGSLADTSLHRIRIEDRRVVFAERIPVGERIRYVHQHDDGRIVLWTDSRFLIFLSVSEHSFVSEFVENYLGNLDVDDELRDRVAETLAACQQCHSLESGDHAGGPSLAGIFGAEIASAPFDGYSDALQARSGRWTRENLIAYIADPERYASGTLMPLPAAAHRRRVIEEIVALLEAVALCNDPVISCSSVILRETHQ